MSGKSRGWSEITPLLRSRSSFLEMVTSTATPDSAPSRSIFLGVDVGTGSARAGLFNEDGKLLGSSSSPIQIWKDGNCVEQSSTDIWHAICAAVKSACSLADVVAGEVKGLGFAATCSLVAVDADGSPVTVSWSGDSRRNVIVWMDHRAVEQAERINSRNSPVLQYCGGSLSPEMQPPKDLKTGKKIGTGHETGGLYYLDVEESPTRALTASSSAFEWHCCLGHPSLSLLKRQVRNLGNVSPFSCEACQLSKHHRVSFVPRLDNRASIPFELVHSDIWGPINIVSNKFQYFVTFVDDYSRMIWLFFMKARSELFSIFKVFRKEIKTQFRQKVQILRSDNAKEYQSNSFTTYLSNKGIVHQTSCSYTPQQNGVAERKNRHLLDVTRVLLLHMHVPKHFWSDGILTTCHLINRMSSSVLNGSSPFSILYPSSSPFSIPPKIFGCVCYVHNLGPGFDKLDPRATKCLFVGYSQTQKGYRCYSPALRRYFTIADVIFFESTPYFSETSSVGVLATLAAPSSHASTNLVSIFRS
ncbi:uncharacterized protein LOC122316031 isoform X3 [Carya illinoinensis]|uniref:uncharacterized protein LOC122316031 isoform X3 n=1 Tax=Carya illinoinensis TaxID=32201 RepID=UPI001C71E998|nr:uncharacterized protein LOC122316031 isoform X3 [Carya illinoinensis]